jgi:C-terminal processing protease CtpA/Prc
LGDFIVSIDGQTLEGQGGGAVFRLLNERAGRNTRLRIRRAGDEREVDVAVGSVELVNYRVGESKSPTPGQLQVRESWLKR